MNILWILHARFTFDLKVDVSGARNDFFIADLLGANYYLSTEKAKVSAFVIVNPYKKNFLNAFRLY